MKAPPKEVTEDGEKILRDILFVIEAFDNYHKAEAMLADLAARLSNWLRSSQGDISQSELARQVGINYSYISKIERGHKPSVDIVFALAKLWLKNEGYPEPVKLDSKQFHISGGPKVVPERDR